VKNIEIENRLKVIKILKSQMDNINSKVDELVRNVVRKDFPKAVDIYCPFTRECEKSPFGWCVYTKNEDPESDNYWSDKCLYCGEPYERK